MKYLLTLAALMLLTMSAAPQAPTKDDPFAGGVDAPSPKSKSTHRKDIPGIAKAANAAIVSIVTAAGDKPIAQGTGFLVSADGLIVTNYHVIQEGNVAVVKFSDGTVLVVDGLLAADKVRDLAVIKVHGKTFRTLTLGNSDRLQVGEEVVAIGNPLGLELTVSNGILSGVRTVEKEGGKFLQITAPISHGSSGGPLFNMQGEVVGITSMYFAGGENLNFAIPVNDAKRLLLNQSTKLQNLPNETETKETSKETNGSDVAGHLQDRFRVLSYNQNTRTVVVQAGGRILTTTIIVALMCDGKPTEEFDSDKDCKKSSSIAGSLVGQDLPTLAHISNTGYQGYFIMEHDGGLSVNELRKPNDRFRSEVWWIEKAEVVAHE